MSTNVSLFPLASYPAGTHDFGPVAVPPAVNTIEFDIQRCTTPTPTVWSDPAVQVVIDFSFSYDNGASWADQGGNPMNGGIVTDKAGNEVAFSRISIGPWDQGMKPTNIKGSITISGGALFSSGNVTIS